jgi:putative transposase
VTDEAIALLAPRIGTRAACAAAGVPQATWYRRHRTRPPPPRQPRCRMLSGSSPRALAPAERTAILDVLHTGRFADTAPAEVWAILLDEGTYLGSVSTFYRVLREAGESRERRAQATHPAAVKPELIATGPDQVYSWDITKLHGPAKWTYYHLYVILDIYSRYVVGWMVATRPGREADRRDLRKQGITRGQLSIRADRGSSMTSKPVALLLADLGITQSHSRPHVSNDNPYSEAQFKTLKYRPAFPARFASIEAARAHCQDFFPWYNNEHRHGGLGLHTAADVHYGRAAAVRAGRAQIPTAAYLAHPERFVRKPPVPPQLPGTSWINPPQEKQTSTQGSVSPKVFPAVLISTFRRTGSGRRR